MKTTKIIKIPAKPETTKEVITYGCDICDYENKSLSMFLNCSICRRVVCKAGPKSCHRYEYDMGDYPDYFCFICHNLKFDVYKEELEQLELKYESDTDALEEKILQDSLYVEGNK